MTGPRQCLVLDIETALDRAATHRAARDGPNAFPQPWLHRVVAVSTLAFEVDLENGEVGTFQLDSALACDPAEEVGLLEYVEDRLSWLEPDGLLITWNGTAHDLPVLEHGRLRHWLFTPLRMQQVHRPGSHQDLMREFSSRARWPALVDVCASLGVPCDPTPGVRNIDRSEVLRAKGQTDVVATFLLHCFWAARDNGSRALLVNAWTAVADHLLASAPTQPHLTQFATCPAALIARKQAQLPKC